MSVQLSTVLAFCEELLGASSIKDYCPNGLQVEGKSEVSKIIGGVTASQALIDRAVSEGADAILVHHGYFWKGEAQQITGIKKRRIQTLLQHDISLIAYHLPLDAHTEVGNNAMLAKRLGIQVDGPLDPFARPVIGNCGSLPESMSAEAFRQHVSGVLGRECQLIGDPDQEIKTLAWCTGAAQGMIEQAVARGVDAYLSGEISEPTVHLARETGVCYFAAGHHATERDGVRALGQKLHSEMDLQFEFIDIDNPV